MHNTYRYAASLNLCQYWMPSRLCVMEEDSAQEAVSPELNIISESKSRSQSPTTPPAPGKTAEKNHKALGLTGLLYQCV